MLRILSLSICISLFTAFSVIAQPIAYIGSNNNNNVSIVNVPTNEIVSIFNVGNGSVSDIAVSPDQSTVYFAGFSTFLTVVDTSNNNIMAQVNTGLVNSFAVTPDGNRIFLTSSVSDTLTVVRTSDYTVTDVIPLGDAPDGISITPNGAKAYIADQIEEAVYVIDTATVMVTSIIPIPGGSLVRDICVEPNGGFVYVSSTGNNRVTVIDTATDTVIDTVFAGDSPRNIAFTPDGQFAYVPNGSSNDVTVIRTSDHSVVDTIPTSADNTNGVDITPDGQFVYVTAIFSDDVTVIRTSTNTVIDTISGPTLDGLVNGGRFIANIAPPAAVIPTLSEWGLIALAGIMLIAASFVLLRRKAVV